jgi:hypothetical protein
MLTSSVQQFNTHKFTTNKVHNVLYLLYKAPTYFKTCEEHQFEDTEWSGRHAPTNGLQAYIEKHRQLFRNVSRFTTNTQNRSPTLIDRKCQAAISSIKGV